MTDQDKAWLAEWLRPIQETLKSIKELLWWIAIIVTVAAWDLHK